MKPALADWLLASLMLPEVGVCQLGPQNLPMSAILASFRWSLCVAPSTVPTVILLQQSDRESVEQSRADRQRTRGQRAPTTPERSSSSRRQRTNWFSRRQRPNCRTISTFVKCRRRRAVGAGARSETPQRRELKAELGGRRVWKQG